VNLYGHAVVAGWVRSDPRFVLGAMLPDLGKLAGHRRLVPGDPEAIAGVAWHHRTDDAFHGSRVFGTLVRAGQARLEQGGVPRGAAMAVAHVGLELLLDGVLLADEPGQSAYLGAVGSVASELALGDPIASADLEALLGRMRAVGLPLHYREADRVARRVIAILEPRPRLAVPVERLDVVLAWAQQARADVERDAEGLVEELRVALVP